MRFRTTEAPSHTTETQLSDTDDGEEFFNAHPELFIEKTVAPGVDAAKVVEGARVDATTEPDLSIIPSAPLQPPVRPWSPLSPDEQDRVRGANREFIQDALEIVERADLFGYWEVLVLGRPEDGQVTLQVELFPDRESTAPVQVEIFPVGRYPITAPQIRAVQGGAAPAHRGLLERFKQLCVSDVWSSRYRRLTQRRLFHLADGILAFQSADALFRHHAAASIGRGRQGWELAQENALQLLYRFESPAGRHCVTVEPGRRYPLEPPSVRCLPVPASNAWLGTGEMHWPSARPDDARSLWHTMLRHKNPLGELVPLVEEMAGKPNRR